jgi:hypothetical protein
MREELFRCRPSSIIPTSSRTQLATWRNPEYSWTAYLYRKRSEQNHLLTNWMRMRHTIVNFHRGNFSPICLTLADQLRIKTSNYISDPKVLNQPIPLARNRTRSAVSQPVRTEYAWRGSWTAIQGSIFRR